MSFPKQPICTENGAPLINDQMLRDSAVLPFNQTRTSNVRKREHMHCIESDDETKKGEGFIVPYETFVKVESERNNYSSRILKQLCAVNLIAKTNQRLVNAIKVVSSKAVISHFNREDQQLVVFDLEEDRQRTISTEEEYFETDNVMFIASWKEFVLAYTIPYLDDGEAALVLINMNTKIATKIQAWDLLVYWNQRHLMKADPGSGMPSFGCSISNNGEFALLMGPSETFGSDWGCKLLHIPTETYIQTIEIPDYKYAVCACFHPTKYEVAMICKERNYRFTQDHGSKETMGTLVMYDLSTNAIKATYLDELVSSEVIRFSPDGKVLVARFDNAGAIGLLDTDSLKCLRIIEHDHLPVANNPFVKDILYKIFPLFSSNGKECSMLQYKDSVLMDNKKNKMKWSNGVKWVSKVPIPQQNSDNYDNEKDDISNGKRFKKEVNITLTS